MCVVHLVYARQYAVHQDLHLGSGQSFYSSNIAAGCTISLRAQRSAFSSGTIFKEPPSDDPYPQDTSNMKGTIAVEEAIIDQAGVEAHTFAQFQSLMRPGSDETSGLSAHEKRLLDIHDERLKKMDEHGVEYMLLSLTSPGVQGEADAEKGKKMAQVANDYLAGEVKKNPKRFGALAALSMHNAKDAAEELRRAIKELGMFGGLVNDFQSKGAEAYEKVYFDTPEYESFWQTVQELDVPIYFHPRYAIPQDLAAGTKYGDRRHLLGAGVQFHLDLSWHLYAICSSGIFDRFPKVQIVAGHLGEG